MSRPRHLVRRRNGAAPKRPRYRPPATSRQDRPGREHVVPAVVPAGAARGAPAAGPGVRAELARYDLGSHEDVTPQETIPGESPPWALTVRGPEARERTVGRLERIHPSAKEYAKD